MDPTGKLGNNGRINNGVNFSNPTDQNSPVGFGQQNWDQSIPIIGPVLGLKADRSNNNADRTPRHTDAGNYLFADGHVKSVRPGNISAGYNADSSDCFTNSTASVSGKSSCRTLAAAGTAVTTDTANGNATIVGTFSLR